MSTENENIVKTTDDEAKLTFKAAVKTALAANGNTTWGVTESMAVIKDLHELAYNEDLGFEPIEKFIREVVNPNQFANKLESAGKIVRVKQRGRSRSVDISDL